MWLQFLIANFVLLVTFVPEFEAVSKPNPMEDYFKWSGLSDFVFDTSIKRYQISQWGHDRFIYKNKKKEPNPADRNLYETLQKCLLLLLYILVFTRNCILSHDFAVGFLGAQPTSGFPFVHRKYWEHTDPNQNIMILIVVINTIFQDTT